MGTWKKAIAIAAAVLVAGASGAAAAKVAENSPSSPAPTRSVRALGGGTSESKFVPITPCRILDTRKGFGKLQVGTPITIDVRGSGATFTAQGGRKNGCAIPTSATAISASITAVDAGSGFLRAWPPGGGQPTSTFMNYDPSFNVSNSGDLALCATGCAADKDLTLRAFGSPTDLVIDVAGYYEAPMSANVASDGTLGRNSRATGVTTVGTGTYILTFDRNISTCTYFGGTATTSEGTAPGFVAVTNSSGDPNGVYVKVYNTSGASANLGFQVQVVC
ncbi:MAG: hypothetical protein U0P45_02720 [Acidimicrobiales bacterium]